MKYILVIASIFIFSSTFFYCSTATEPELKTIPLGIWQSTNGAAFNYLVLFKDNSFLYAENDLTVQSQDENGLEVGTYSYDQGNGNISFNIDYDDNDPGNDSGIGDKGTPVVTDALLSNGNKTLTLASGALVLASVDTITSSPVVGAWRRTDGAGFNILILFENNTFLYAENDLTVTLPEENGLEVGTYVYNQGDSNITFNIIYDDNDPGNDSGVGDIGKAIITDALLSNNNSTLTIAGGALVLSKEF